MTISKTTLANIALYTLKNSRTVTDIDSDTGTQATVLNTFFEIALRTVLAKNDWSFARKIAAISNVEDDPNDEWKGSWRTPADCVRPLYIVDGNRTPSKTSPHASFEQGVDVTGGLIFCDFQSDETVTLKYTMYQTTVSFWKPRFAMAFAYKWAELAAPALTGGDPTGLGRIAAAMFEAELLAAIAEDTATGQKDAPAESEFITGR